MWMNSLSFLDNQIINVVIIVVLFLYISCIFDNINNFVGNLYNFSIVRILVLLFIIYVAPKDMTIALLLALSYIISIYYMVNNEETFINNKQLQQAEESIIDIEKKSIQNIQNSANKALKKISQEAGTEHFFPLMDTKDNENSFNKPSNENTQKMMMSSSFPSMPLMSNSNRNQEIVDVISTKDSCINNYNEKFEAVGDVCDPVATFEGELNPQGINFPMGFDSNVNGSPLG